MYIPLPVRHPAVKHDANVLTLTPDDFESTSSNEEENRSLRNVLWRSCCHNSWLSPLYTHHHSKCVLLYRTYSILLTLQQSGPAGAQQAGSWSCRESFIAVCVSNIPVVYPTVARIYHRMGSSTIVSKISGPANSYQLSPTKERAHRKKLSPYSIPDDTVLASSDRIAMVPNGSTKIEGTNEREWYGDSGHGIGKNDIRVKTEIDIESLQGPKAI